MSIQFQLVAYTDAAGKYNPEAYLNGNEDNFFTDADLSGKEPKPPFGQVTTLSEEGVLMVVADGMGGQNAGEVASGIAIDTVKDLFAPGKITPDMAASHESRKAYMEKTIIEADKRIKQDVKNHKDHQGMGSTMIMVWIANNEISISWIGDSRAYIYNPINGLQPISKDHSYVQSLVDKGVITYDQAFDHPQGNIVLRSLGDTTKTAEPESRLYTLSNNDIILLCSDGLSGVLRDRKTYEDGQLIEGENIEDIIAANKDDLQKCKDELFAAAEKADWYDNVTAILCKICSGADSMPNLSKEILGGENVEEGNMVVKDDTDSQCQTPKNIRQPVSSSDSAKKNISNSLHIHVSKRGMLALFCGIAIIIFGACFVMFKVFSNTDKHVPLQKDTVYIKQEIPADTLKKDVGSSKDSSKTIKINELKETLKKNKNKGNVVNGNKTKPDSELTEIPDSVKKQ